MELQGKGTMSDEQIVELYWQRDERAIQETDRKYQHFLLTVAHNILRDGRDCEECLNDTYLGAWNAMPPARPNALRAFLPPSCGGRPLIATRRGSGKSGSTPS